MTHTLRSTIASLAKADADFYRSLGVELGGAGSGGGRLARRGQTSGAPGRDQMRANINAAASTGKVSNVLRASLREMAQSDARMFRDMAKELGTPKPRGGSGQVGGSQGGKALPAAKKTKPRRKPKK